jgi:hypothetical protein
LNVYCSNTALIGLDSRQTILARFMLVLAR